jgi:anti-sigma-K factor RskA
VLTVTVDAPTSGADGFREVWLIDSEVRGMVSLGPLEGGTGQFVIPAGVDVGQFPIVDVSLEPVDGVPTHSGNSIVRGTLDA